MAKKKNEAFIQCSACNGYGVVCAECNSPLSFLNYCTDWADQLIGLTLHKGSVTCHICKGTGKIPNDENTTEAKKGNKRD